MSSPLARDDILFVSVELNSVVRSKETQISTNSNGKMKISKTQKSETNQWKPNTKLVE